MLTQTSDIDLRGWSHEKFVQCCILAGCDYLKNPRGIAFKTAHALFEKFQTIQNVLTYLQQRAKHPVDDEYVLAFERAYLAFRYQRVWCPLKRAVVSLNDFEFAKLDITKQLDGKSVVKDLSRLAGLGQQSLERELLLKHLKLSLLEFLGPAVDPVVAEQLSQGKLDPVSHKPFAAVEFQFDPRELTLKEIQGLGFRNIAESVLTRKPREGSLQPTEMSIVNLTVEFDEEALNRFDETKHKRLEEGAKSDPQQALLRLLVSSQRPGEPRPAAKQPLDSDCEDEAPLPNFSALNRQPQPQAPAPGLPAFKPFASLQQSAQPSRLKDAVSKFRLEERKKFIEEKTNLTRAQLMSRLQDARSSGIFAAGQPSDADENDPH